MSTVTSGSAKLSRWVTIAIILAVALLSGCLQLSLIVSDTFQQEASETSQDLPTDSFIVDLGHEDAATLLPLLHQIPQLVPGVSELATAKRTTYIPTSTFTKNGQKHIAMEGLSFKAIDPEFFSIRGFAPAQGRFFDAADGPYASVIGAELATTGGYKLGSVIRRPYMDRQYEVIGILQPNDGVADHPFSVHSPLKEKYGVNSIMFIPVDGTPELLPPELDGAYFNTIAESMKTMVQLWIGVDATQNMTTVMENTLAYIESLPGVHVIQASPTPPTKATYEYVSEQTSSSLEQMGFIVIAVGALSISGLMLMHVLLGAKVIGIKRALGATRDRLVWENLWRYSLLSLCGFLLSLILIQPLLPLIGNFLGVELQVLPKTLLFAMLGVTALAPLCGLIPTVEASKVSPLDAIRDRLGWGLGKRRLDLRQIIVSLAFAAAVGTMFLVSQIGFSTLAGIDANLRAIGRDMLLVEEPPAGSVSPMPTLSEADDASLCVP